MKSVLSSSPIAPIDEAADLVVGVRREARVCLHLPRHHATLVLAERIPRGDLLRTRREPGPGRNDAHLDLPRERLLAELVPALVELAAVFLDPFLGHMVRRMRRARREVDEERLLRRERLLRLDPRDGLVGHVGGEVVVRVERRVDAHRAVDDRGRPLVGFGREKAVELVESRVRGPAVERARHRRLPRGRLVRLAERSGAVAVEAQDLRKRSHALRAHACVAGERGRELGDRAHVVHMVVAAREQRGARGRAERRRVKAVETLAVLREPLEGRHLARTAERARVAEAHVVDEHDHDVRRARGRTHLEALRRHDLARVDLGDRGHGRLRDR
jgi:hypothetical protein